MKYVHTFWIFLLLATGSLFAETPDSITTKVFQFDLREEVGPGIWRKMQKAIGEAKEYEADIFLINMNTYGGQLIAADSMRTAIMNLDIPSYVFIDNNAASAGALISIACDSIYMRPGANIGAATVVNGTDGKAMPDKYQSYMRSMMRSTAESHGSDTLNERGQQLVHWHRDPRIAEAMVDDRIFIPNVIDSGKTLTFTTNEAMMHGYCEGKAENIAKVLEQSGIKDYELTVYQPSFLQKIISFMVNPALQGILLLIILGGIWFELQSPGIGFPILAAALAALLYFLPLLLEGVAESWEVALFILGVILLLVEFFVIPGFGIAGISGIALMLLGLVLSLVDTLDFEFNRGATYNALMMAIFQVAASFIIFIILAFAFGGTFFKTRAFRRLSLDKQMRNEEGFVSSDSSLRELIGKEGTVLSDLRPSGSVKIDGEYFDAIAISGFINKGKSVIVRKFELGQLYVEEV